MARWCVIYNPSAARGGAERTWRRIQRSWSRLADFRASAGPADAEVLARLAAGEGYDIVAAAGGDGTVHEVANGLLSAARPQTALAVFPIGSANDYAHALGVCLRDCLDPDRPRRQLLADVGLVRLATGKERYFVNTLGLGFSAAVSFESRRVSRFTGLALYGTALVRALLFRFEATQMHVAFDQFDMRGPVLSLTIALGPREGNFVVAPDARLDDGLFDYLVISPLSRLGAVSLLPRLAAGRGLPRQHPQIRMGRCRLAKVDSTRPLTIHVDGELLCVPEDDARQLAVQLVPGALPVLI
jgi:diacylglycerol kinase family enzyme